MAPSSEVLAARFRTGAIITAAVVGVFGSAVLIGGWWLDVSVLRQPLTDYTAMRAGTAAAFVVVAIGLLSSTTGVPRWITGIAGGLLLCGGAIVIAGYLTGPTKLPVESWPVLRAGSDELVPGRIAVNTAASFVLLGIGLILLSLRRSDGLRQALGVAAAFVAFAALIGYATTAFQVAGRFASGFTEMALHTAIPMFAMGCALMLVSLDAGWARVFAERQAGGRLARTFLPAVLLLFLVAAWLYGVIGSPQVTAGGTYTSPGSQSSSASDCWWRPVGCSMWTSNGNSWPPISRPGSPTAPSACSRPRRCSRRSSIRLRTAWHW